MIETTLSTSRVSRITDDLLVVPIIDERFPTDDVRQLDAPVDGHLLREARQHGFQGRADETFLFQTHHALPSRHVLLAGCGPANPGAWDRLADLAVRTLREVRGHRLVIALGDQANAASVGALAAGVPLAAYRFTRFRSRPDAERPIMLTLAVPTAGATLVKTVDRALVAAESTCYARDLINTPAAELTPAGLGREARRLMRGALRGTIHNRRSLARLGMGALLGVGQGSPVEPCLIELVYRPRGNTRRRVALIGKGITFDSGGLSLKPADSMRTQKRDMAGGALVLAVMRALPALRPPVEVRGYVPAAENMPSGTAIRPGDVVRACNGKTIEVLNTDAEGRLVLADALAYAARRKPDLMLDVATLTAAVTGALGNRYAAIMGSDRTLVAACIAAGATANENLWELPLVSEYRRDLDSTVADLKNIGEGQAGTIIGGLFLREFTADIPWAHIDFSSTAFSSGYPCHPVGASGFGIRTVLNYLLQL